MDAWLCGAKPSNTAAPQLLLFACCRPPRLASWRHQMSSAQRRLCKLQLALQGRYGGGATHGDGNPAQVQQASSQTRRQTATVSNSIVQLELDVAGGSIGSFRFHDNSVNPLSWRAQVPADSSEPCGLGHFLCCDRWGQPSDAELANGMPFHGEASKQTWCVAERTDDTASLSMQVSLPMAGMHVQRSVALGLAGCAVARVVETVRNTNPLGRVYNMVQHPSIAPPFLDERTVVDCNGGAGFAQDAWPDLEAEAAQWPIVAGVDVRSLHSSDSPGVTSFVIDDE
jgi:hypothetical protein